MNKNSIWSMKIVRANKQRKLRRLEREVETVKVEIAELDSGIEKGGEGA